MPYAVLSLQHHRDMCFLLRTPELPRESPGDSLSRCISRSLSLNHPHAANIHAGTYCLRASQKIAPHFHWGNWPYGTFMRKGSKIICTVIFCLCFSTMIGLLLPHTVFRLYYTFLCLFRGCFTVVWLADIWQHSQAAIPQSCLACQLQHWGKHWAGTFPGYFSRGEEPNDLSEINFCQDCVTFTTAATWQKKPPKNKKNQSYWYISLCWFGWTYGQMYTVKGYRPPWQL